MASAHPEAQLLKLSDLSDFLVAKVALTRAALRLRRTPEGSLVHPNGIGSFAPDTHVNERDIAERWARAVRRAARYGLAHPNCFARSLALASLLRRHGVQSGQLHFGVRTGATGFEAHAWVTVAGSVVGDDPGFVGRFREIRDLSLVERR